MLDAAEDLRAGVRYDEFVIASGDTDMTPLLVRLRAGDRLVTIFSPSEPAAVLGAIAHHLIGGEDLLELLQPDPADPTEGLGQPGAERARLDGATSTDATRSIDGPLDPQEAKLVFETFVRERYSTAPEALSLPALAHQISHEIASAGKATRWFGHGGFRKALQALDLPGARMSDRHLWDDRRHGVPHADEQDGPETPPEAVARVASDMKMQVMSRQAWPLIFTSLAKFVNAYEFNLAEATKWARDQVAKQGVEVNRKAVSAVAFGTAYGGCPLYRKPPPAAAEIGEAFVTNVLARAAAADVELSKEEVRDVRSWFGVGGPVGTKVG